MLKQILVMMLLAPGALVWGAASDEATLGNGLEVDSTTSLPVLIEELSKEAKKIGLSHKRIETRVNQSLRKAGITPVSARAGIEAYLYVRVKVMAGGGFTIFISFERTAFYLVGGKWFTTRGSTWNTSGIGVGGDVNYILDSIAQSVEVFCNEFLKANGK
jgi:hypothetical protein